LRRRLSDDISRKFITEKRRYHGEDNPLRRHQFNGRRQRGAAADVLRRCFAIGASRPISRRDKDREQPSSKSPLTRYRKIQLALPSPFEERPGASVPWCGSPSRLASQAPARRACAKQERFHRHVPWPTPTGCSRVTVGVPAQKHVPAPKSAYRYRSKTRAQEQTSSSSIHRNPV